jgi:dTDP-4-amino-4,6-dideoxygalactose transaminase
VLNAQLDRLERQTITRDRNGRYLAARLAAVAGIHPQKRPANCTRHSYHLFMLRLDPGAFGAPRPAVIQALQAEGIPCSGGYGFSLHRQPMFRNKAFGPYLPKALSTLDYRKVHCPNSDLLCREQCIWLEQSMFLGNRGDMEDIANAFEKISENQGALNQWAKQQKGAA